MIRNTMSKVMRLGRATVFLVGLTVILALVFGVTSTALGANGKPFILGEKNVATAVSKLVGSVAGPSLLIGNGSEDARATALQLNVKSGKPPLKVNSSAGKARNLNADKLDGKNASDFLGTNGKAADADKLDGIDSTGFYTAGSKVADSDKVDGKDSSEFAAATHDHDDRYFTETESDGRYLGKTGKAADADKLDGIDSSGFVKGKGRVRHGAIAMSGNNEWTILTHLYESPDITVHYWCPYDPLSTDGGLMIRNWGEETINVFSDNGGADPNRYEQLTKDETFGQSAALGGEHITLQVQGSGIATIEVFSIHRKSDGKCHVQAQGLFTY